MKDSTFFLFMLISFCITLKSSASDVSSRKKEASFPLTVSIEKTLQNIPRVEDPLGFSRDHHDLRCCKEDGTPCDPNSEKKTPSKAEDYRRLKEESESVRGSSVLHKMEYISIGKTVENTK